jgi:alanine racemase
MPHPFRSFALISRERIARNYRNVCEAVGPGVEVVPVVKANAYGHGAPEVSRVLAGAGARWLAVSTVEEGVWLREAGIDTRVLVMAGFLPFEREALLEYDLTPAVQSLAEVAEIDRVARELGRILPYHLKVDTGMGRLGTRDAAEKIIEAIRNARHARIEGLMSHLASAGDFTTEQTGGQIACFRALRNAVRRAGIEPKYAHIAATHAVAYPAGADGNMVRPGLGIYGYVSPARGQAPECVLNVAPALTWKARIVAVKEVGQGAPLGYGATYRATRPMRIAVIAAGYADGIFRSLSNRGKVIAAGQVVPMLGSVCMDLTTIDISHTTALAPGDEVTLLGEEGDARLDAEQIAAVAGTIPYEILCAIGMRVRRVYVQ